MGEAVTLDMGSAGLKPRPSLGPWSRPSLRTRVQPAKVRAVIPTMAEGVTLDMGETGLQSRSSLRPWPGPSFWAQLWLGEARIVTPAMGATKVLSQTNVAKLESSYQALPSSSIA
ncbi:unnamed protein product [Prunus armeniaca]